VKRYLVTGGCGFIGSHLCEALRGAGHAVRVLDDLSSGKRGNLAPGAELVLGNVSDPDVVRTAVADIDGCFHLAAIASVQRGVTEWRATHQVNAGGTVTVLEAIAALPPARRPPVVYASSAAVYGDCATLPITEDMPCRPLSAYGADKYASELHARVAGEVHGIPTAGLRFFNVFGARQDPGSPYSGVISIFCDRLLRGQAVHIFGDGGQTRDFIHVSGVVAALRAAMAHCAAGGGRDAPVFNVCTGRPISVTDLAGTIAGLCGTNAGITHGGARPGEIRHSCGSPARLRRELGLGEPCSLSEGLADVLAWMRIAAVADAAG